MYVLARELGEGGEASPRGEGFGKTWELGPTQHSSAEAARRDSFSLRGWTHIVRAEKRVDAAGFSVVEAITLDTEQRVEAVYTEAEVQARLEVVRAEAGASVAEAMGNVEGLNKRIRELSREKAGLERRLKRALERIEELERGATAATNAPAVEDTGGDAEPVPARDTTKLFAQEGEVDGEPYSAASLLQAKQRDVVIVVDDENLDFLQRMVRMAGWDGVALSPGQHVKGRVIYRDKDAYFSVANGTDRECLVAAGNMLPFARGRLFALKN